MAYAWSVRIFRKKNTTNNWPTVQTSKVWYTSKYNFTQSRRQDHILEIVYNFIVRYSNYDLCDMGHLTRFKILQNIRATFWPIAKQFPVIIHADYWIWRQQETLSATACSGRGIHAKFLQKNTCVVVNNVACM